MKHYYAFVNNETGFIEITEEEFLSLYGNEIIGPYATKVYRGQLSLEEVPSEYQVEVQAVVDAKIAYWGSYENREISDSQALDIIMGGTEE